MPWLSQLIETITTYEWWQIIAIIAAIAFIPVIWRIDPNKILESLTGHIERKRREKISANCFHVWLIYPVSNLAKCGSCLVWIQYSTLELHKSLGCCSVAIVGEHNVLVKPSKNSLFLATPHNKRTKAN